VIGVDTGKFLEIVDILERDYDSWDAPAKRFEDGYERTPYTILCSTLLSFRSRDEQTLASAKRLFSLAKDPEKMVTFDVEEIREKIYPIGLHHSKARSILSVSIELLERFGGEVPRDYDSLVSIRGIGPKTANIVLENAFGEDVVAVDTHLHRICNLWGYIDTSNPAESQEILMRKVPIERRKGLNRLLVSFGQTICRPSRPLCEECPVSHLCPIDAIEDDG
jgi:endonuclease-3